MSCFFVCVHRICVCIQVHVHTCGGQSRTLVPSFTPHLIALSRGSHWTQALLHFPWAGWPGSALFLPLWPLMLGCRSTQLFGVGAGGSNSGLHSCKVNVLSQWAPALHCVFVPFTFPAFYVVELILASFLRFSFCFTNISLAIICYLDSYIN